MRSIGPMLRRMSNRLTWLTQSEGAHRLGIVLAVATALGALGATIVAVMVLRRDKPLDGLGILLLLAIPTVAVGQLWMLGQIETRSGSLANPMRLFFGDLSRTIAVPLLAMAVLGVILAVMAAGPLLGNGNRSECPYELVKDGTRICVTKSEYERTTTHGQRFASGGLLALFSLQFGAALSGLASRPSRAMGRAHHGDGR